MSNKKKIELIKHIAKVMLKSNEIITGIQFDTLYDMNEDQLETVLFKLNIKK